MKVVVAKGRRYEYFDTGTRNDAGRPILNRLPARDDVEFGRVYASMLAGRTRRANIAIELTLPKLIDLYELSPEFRQLAPATQKSYGVYLRLIADKLNTAPARGLERRDVMLLRDTLGDRTGAANGMVRTMRALFAWARKREHVEHDPCRGIELFKSVDYEPWPDDLLAAALQSEDAAIRVPVALLYFTAQRIGDACAMRWSDIREGRVHVTQQKTGKALEIRLHRDLVQILADIPKRGLTILADKRGRGAKVDSVRERLQAFAQLHGVQVVPHGLRKNAVNALLEVGCSVAETASVTGQSLQMIEHYAKRRSTRKLASAAILKMEGGKA